jgi:non-ribosomal peptide synthetase-like protein
MDGGRDIVPAVAIEGAQLPQLLREETLWDHFAATVDREPDRLALRLLGDARGSGDAAERGTPPRAFTYRQLDERVGLAAAALVARGIGPGQFVGLWLRRSLDLHVAMLAILRAGAAFIPFDADAPLERVAKCLTDCDACLLLTHEAHVATAARLSEEGVVTLEALLLEGAGREPPEHRATGRDPAYAIYTSGSTGEPKGILVTHANVCHYVRSVNETLGIRADDVVLQQASVAFDLSIEEIFVPYAVGASMAVADEVTLRDIDRLADVIEAAGVTVVDTVPTLLAMLPRVPASVRLVIVGGEACPPAVVERWAGGGRRMLNTYGPTETTVVATAGELRPGEPVTIGRPLANYTAYVVDEGGRPVPPGEAGELWVGGPGVTAGYIGRPELTAEKFVANPFAHDPGRDPVLYRTGDAVTLDGEGLLHFHGRIDAQVKIRGYRIELGEIEARIAALEGVRTAAVSATPQGSGGDVLVAHVVMAEGCGLDKGAARAALAMVLPAYMVPTFWQEHAELPLLASGKVDRKALMRVPLPGAGDGATEQEPPATLTEGHLLAAAKGVLGRDIVPFEADFFEELGGHSLLAARFVSEVRKVPHLAGIALQDVYDARTLRRLAGMLDERLAAAGGAAERVDLSFEPPPLRRRFLCGLAQAVALPFIIAIVTAQWIGLLLSSIYLVRDNAPFWHEILLLCGIYVALNLGAKVVVVALKWLLLGRTKPGVYPLWGSYYFRIWLLQRLVHLTSHKFLQGSPLMRIYLRALGAKVGRDAVIHEFEEGAVDLLEIGPRVSTGIKVRFANVEVIGNQMHIGRIRLEADVSIGNACVLGRDTVVGAGAELGDLTSLPAGTVVGPGELWDGAPARHVGPVPPSDLPPHPESGNLARALRTSGYFLTYNLVMMIGLLPIFPAFYVLMHFDKVMLVGREGVVPWEWVVLLAWPAALVLVFVSMAVAVAMRWLLFPRRVVPGRHSIHGWFYYRKWTMGLATESMLETLNSLYATVFMRNWYRAMGTTVGRGTEISANFSGRYDLVTLGENNFIGDEAIFGDEDVRGGWMTLERVQTGDRAFFGNLCVIPKGSVIGDDSLLGVKSRMPESLRIEPGETWFGSPAIPIPNRQRVTLAANWTYRPPWHMRWGRIVFEALHTSLPTAVLISLAYITADIIEFPIDAGHYGTALGVFIVAGVVTGMIMLLVSVLFKWLLMGIYRPVQKPMWSWWAMRTEATAVLYGGLASKVLLDYVRGTPFMPWLLRLYGTRIGKGVWINCADVTEFDCIRIGDYAVINMWATPQTHLYEDRVMKVGRIDIGKGVTLGTSSVVLYDTSIGDWARLEPLTVVMKGESIPAHTVWSGAPARHVPVAREPGLAASASVAAPGSSAQSADLSTAA